MVDRKKFHRRKTYDIYFESKIDKCVFILQREYILMKKIPIK